MICQLVALRVFSTHVPGRPRFVIHTRSGRHIGIGSWVIRHFQEDDFVLQMDFFFWAVSYLYVGSLRIELYYIAAAFSSLMLALHFPPLGRVSYLSLHANLARLRRTFPRPALAEVVHTATNDYTNLEDTPLGLRLLPNIARDKRRILRKDTDFPSRRELYPRIMMFPLEN